MDERVDVLIVGASQAGLFAAALLAREGLKVTVVDQRPAAVLPARRTLIVTPYLGEGLGVRPNSALLHTVERMRIVSPNRKTHVEFRRGDWIIERAEFLKELEQQAREAGARLEPGTRFLGIEHSNGRVRIAVRREGTVRRLRADHLVGADGVASRVARASGLRRPPRVRIVQAEIRLPLGWDYWTGSVWVEPDLCRHFVWLLPTEGTRGVLGVVEDLDRNPLGVLKVYVDRLGLRVLGYQGAKVAMYDPKLRPFSRVHGLPVYLIGDAAGQVKVTTVGGTVTGLRGAQALARSILQGVPYPTALRDLDRELRIHWWIKRGLQQLDGHGYDLLVDRVSGRLREILERYTRDELTHAAWKALRSDMRLAAWAVRHGLWGLVRMVLRQG